MSLHGAVAQCPVAHACLPSNPAIREIIVHDLSADGTKGYAARGSIPLAVANMRLLVFGWPMPCGSRSSAIFVCGLPYRLRWTSDVSLLYRVPWYLSLGIERSLGMVKFDQCTLIYFGIYSWGDDYDLRK
jgi:hypothetical protein